MECRKTGSRGSRFCTFYGARLFFLEMVKYIIHTFVHMQIFQTTEVKNS